MAKKNILKKLLGTVLAAAVLAGSSGVTAFAEKLEFAETIDEDGNVYTEEYTDDGSVPDEKKESTKKKDKEEQTKVPDDNGKEESASSAKEGEKTAVAGGAGVDNRVVTVPAKNIRLLQKVRTNLELGKTSQIKYLLIPVKSDDYVTYKNLTKNVVKVDENGLVTAIGYGDGMIEIKTSSGVRANVYYTVKDPNENGDQDASSFKPSSMEFADKFIMLRKGKTAQAEPVFYPFGSSDTLSYSSSNSSVASVSSAGKITGTGAGSAVITAKTPGGITAEINVTVYDDILRGIDVSKWQGSINWKKVSVSGVDFAMIRSSFGSEHTDEFLDSNVRGCEANGIPYGFYHYTYAKSAAEARKEAKYFLNAIRKYKPEYPVVLDIEEEFYKKMSKKKVTSIITAFMDEIENAGYYGMIYNSPNFMKSCINYDKIKKYDIWIACWGDEDRLCSLYDGHYGMWQYSSTGKVRGINGDVDLDYSYKDYAAIIRKKGLNRL